MRCIASPRLGYYYNSKVKPVLLYWPGSFPYIPTHKVMSQKNGTSFCFLLNSFNGNALLHHFLVFTLSLVKHHLSIIREYMAHKSHKCTKSVSMSVIDRGIDRKIERYSTVCSPNPNFNARVASCSLASHHQLD